MTPQSAVTANEFAEFLSMDRWFCHRECVNNHLTLTLFVAGVFALTLVPCVMITVDYPHRGLDPRSNPRINRPPQIGTMNPSAETQQTHLRLLRSVESQGGPLLARTETFVMCR